MQTLAEDRKLIFISGPRQCGKTTFARSLADAYANTLYFNWDSITDKKKFTANPLFFQELNRTDKTPPLIMLDEIHKYSRWKNYLKGVYDEFADAYQFVITGSGRLDLSKRGGDALTGRYVSMNLFPFTLSELCSKRRRLDAFRADLLHDWDLNPAKETGALWERLSAYGGFPEPFVKNDASFWRRWSETFAQQIVREDIRTLTEIKDLDTLELLVSMLPSKVGSPFSVNNIAAALQVSFDTVKSWIKLLEDFYVSFSIGTWTPKIPRSILKERKLYLYNYPEVSDASLRFENMAALELYRAVTLWNDLGWGRFSLHYLKNKEKEEVDFLLAEERTPFLIIEAKMNDESPSKSLLHFQKVLDIPAVQLTRRDNIRKIIRTGGNDTLVVSAHRWLSSLP
ncbi:MAG: ATP-binding protein [Spirochaetota bacterium]